MLHCLQQWLSSFLRGNRCWRQRVVLPSPLPSAGFAPLSSYMGGADEISDDNLIFIPLKGICSFPWVVSNERELHMQRTSHLLLTCTCSFLRCLPSCALCVHPLSLCGCSPALRLQFPSHSPRVTTSSCGSGCHQLG